MFKGEKNLKDPERKPSASYGAGTQTTSLTMSYTKTNKLITALYMVTDIIDKDEPLRNKLRTLGVEILSDPEGKSTSYGAGMSIMRVEQIISFLNIASVVNIISEMNYSILKKEFLELNQSIKESTDKVKTVHRQVNLVEFFKETAEGEFDPYPASPLLTLLKKGRGKEGVYIGQENSKGHTRIGVQKGSTLMQALSRVEVSDRINMQGKTLHIQDFNIFKKQRRNDIINIIKTIDGGVTIKDIKDRAQVSQGKLSSLVSCSEKTLQRELVSMVKDNVLKKVGEKRWSRYFLSK